MDLVCLSCLVGFAAVVLLIIWISADVIVLGILGACVLCLCCCINVAMCDGSGAGVRGCASAWSVAYLRGFVPVAPCGVLGWHDCGWCAWRLSV